MEENPRPRGEYLPVLLFLLFLFQDYFRSEREWMRSILVLARVDVMSDYPFMLVGRSHRGYNWDSNIFPMTFALISLFTLTYLTFLFLLCEITLVTAVSVASRRTCFRKAVPFHLPRIWIRIGSTFLRNRSVANVQCGTNRMSTTFSFCESEFSFTNHSYIHSDSVSDG